MLANLKDDSKLQKPKSRIVAKVFESLSDDDVPPIVAKPEVQERTSLDDTINNAKTVNGLLNISMKKDLNRKHALKVREKYYAQSSG